MLITRIELENIKSYRQVAVDFQRGATAISGENGAGKTTLVEAVGFALFGYLPYTQDHFVREGEKNGKVTVHLIGNDARPYTVERRCGTVSRWLVYDEEADMRLEQRADVLDKLHDLFGIDRERPLDSLFRDALGVPQGTFTSIFLEAASKRKQTFDALLQIEDYKTAADYLLDTQKYYKEQMLGQQGEIQRLTFATRDLDEWRTQLKEARLLDEQQKSQNALWSQQLTQHEERAIILDEQLARLNALEQRYQNCQTAHTHAHNLLQQYDLLLQTARAARQAVTESRENHQRYLQAQETLKSLRQDAQRREELRQRQAQLNTLLAKIEANTTSCQVRLEEIAVARQRVVDLAPLVEQQIILEQKRDEAMQKVARYETIVGEGKRLSGQLDQCLQKQEGLQRKIAEIKPLEPLAAALQEHADALTQLKVQASERSGKQRQLQEKRDLLREKHIERDTTAEKLRKVERNITLVEEHRQEAEEMPVLQGQYEQLSAQRHRLEGNIEGYAKSRAQSAGGQCPLLYEACLNIKGRGVASLESYFENLLTEEHARVNQLDRQQGVLTERIERISKYADALNNKLGRYIDARDNWAEHLQRLAREITRLERDISGLTEDLEVLKHVEQQMAERSVAHEESRQADKKVRELAGLYRQSQQLQEQAQQYEADIQERRVELEHLQGSDAQFKRIKAELAALNDPRGLSRAQQAVVAQEAQYQQQLATLQQRQQETQGKLQELNKQVATYATLDSDIAQQEAILALCQEGYQTYLKNETEAQRLPERERAYQQQFTAREQAWQQLQEVEQAYTQARSAFNQEELTSLKAEIEHLRKELLVLAQRMQHHQEIIKELEQKIEQAEVLLGELEAAQREYQTLDDLHSMTEQFRKLVKDAAPHVLRAMLADISAEANRIFGEVMGDRSAQLSWKNDYEIILRRQGVERSFAQLSGGEQMSAALSVRLALLKKLSTLNIAFFDEPTQNMDELRRTNLAEQIRRVRGFDQLIVISHDDTFEQGLDGLVRLKKEQGETHMLDNDALMQSQREQVDIYAS